MKISDYIMEQEINITSCDEIEVERCFAEMEVLGSLVECYAKHALIQEYSTGDISDEVKSSIFQEAAETATKEGTENTAKKKWYEAILNAIKAVGNMILRIFGKLPFDKLLEMVKKMPDGVEFEIPDNSTGIKPANLCVRLMNVTESYAKFAEMLKENSKDIEGYRKIKTLDNGHGAEGSNAFASSRNMSNAAGKTINKAGMIAILEDLSKAGIVPSVRKMLKDIDLSKKGEFAAGETGADLVKVIRETATILSNEYKEVSKVLIKLQNSIVSKSQKALKKEQRADKKEAKKAEKELKKELKNKTDDK